MAVESITAEITLDRAPDDPPEYDPKYQDELAAFGKSLEGAGASCDRYWIALQTAGSDSWQVGEFLLKFASPAIAALAAVAGAWVQGRYGRKVRLKVGDVEVEARTIAEIEQLLERAASFRNSTSKDDGES